MDEDLIKSFIYNELSSMCDNIVTGALDNLDNRKYNIFHGFSDEGKDIVKYMALGRSFDSQLGNRLQRIAMYIARLSYGDNNVPNYVFLNSNRNEKKITVWKFAFPDSLDVRHNTNGFNVYKTQCYYKASDKTDCLKQIMQKNESTLKFLIKEDKGLTSFRGANNTILHREMQAYEVDFSARITEEIYDCKDDNVLIQVENIPKIIPVDLLYFANRDSISVYEIKAGGDLDSKNCESNADEVLDNLKCFSFIEDHNSYFATCYNNRGEGGNDTYTDEDGVIYCGQRPVGGIFNIYEKIDRKSGTQKWADMRNRILVGSKFWEKILPSNVTFTKFIEIYNEAFVKAKLEEKIKDIHYD